MIRNVVKQLRFSFCEVTKTARLTPEEWAVKEKEWRLLAIKRNQEMRQLEYVKSQLTEHQIKYVELVAQAIAELDQYEFQCFYSQLNEHIKQASGIPLVDVNSQWPALKAHQTPVWPPQDKETLDQAMKDLWDGKGLADFQQLFGGSGGSGGGSTSGVAKKTQSESGAKEAAAAPEQKKVEKTNFDIELKAIDPAKKILIIKEVRQIFNLGLKDSKDLVEKAPCTLSKAMKKEDAQKIKEQLEAIGCQINLL